MTRATRALSLVEGLVALAIVSTLLLPIGMFLIEYSRGSDRLGDMHQVLSLLEERMEMALAQPFNQIPLGETSGTLIQGAEPGRGIDLRPLQIGKQQVTFAMQVEMVPVEFSAVIETTSGRSAKIRLDEHYKRLKLVAAWGADKPHSIDLTAYRADL